MECTHSKHNYWRTPCGEVTCDCEYMKTIKRIVKNLIILNETNRTFTNKIKTRRSMEE